MITLGKSIRHKWVKYNCLCCSSRPLRMFILQIVIQATLVTSTMHNSILLLTSIQTTGPDFIPYMFFAFQQCIPRFFVNSIKRVIRHKFSAHFSTLNSYQFTIKNKGRRVHVSFIFFLVFLSSPKTANINNYAKQKEQRKSHLIVSV